MTRIPKLQCILIASLAAGDAAAQSLQSGLERTLIAREPLVVNPVDVSVDVDGSIYTVETVRRKAGDLDIREFTQWVPDTLSHTSVNDRLEFYRKTLVPGGVKETDSFKDHNQDGVLDIRDLTVISERIHRLTDSNGDGTPDTTAVFAEGFNTEVTGVAAGVFAWRGDVFATIVPDLWKLRDTTGDGKADQREALLTGFGVQIAYAGHDMHGVQWGPDGKLYWTIGDKGANVVSKEGVRYQHPLEGLLMRCNPDGTGFEVVARGLRNVQQIAFDDYGNIFGVDNDSDASGEKERFIQIAEGSDTGWRMFYQFRGSDYNPWMREAMSVPSGDHQPAYILPALSSYVDGPSGFARDPGTALNERYRGYFFMTSFPAGNLHAFNIEPDGASFRMVDSNIVDRGQSYVGISFAPDGGLYLADWSGGYALNDKGAVWKIDDPIAAKSELRSEVAAMLKAGTADESDAELVARLNHADQRIRCDAQWELAARPSGPAVLAAAAGRSAHPPLARIHALWGLAQAKVYSRQLFLQLIADDHEQVRSQAAKWAGEAATEAQAELISLLADPSPVVRYHAAIAVGKLRMTDAGGAVLSMLAENDNKDHFLRHAGVMALRGMAGSAASTAATHPSAAVRLAATVVFRNTAAPQAAALLDDADPAIVAEAARSIYDDSGIPAAMPALAGLLEKHPAASEPAIRRAIAANRMLADAESAARLANYAADAAQPEALRLHALKVLATWTSQTTLDSVDGRWNPLEPAGARAARDAFNHVAADLANDPKDTIVNATAATAKALGILTDPAALARLAGDAGADDDLRIAALAALRAQAPHQFLPIALGFLKAASPERRSAAAELLVDSAPDAIADYALAAAAASASIPERQIAIGLLAKLGGPQATAALEALLRDPSLPPELQLDLIEASAKLPDLAAAAADLTNSLAAEGPLGPYLPSLAGGNAAGGERIFKTHLAAQCTACHRLGEEGSNVGPPLAGIGSQNARYLLESLVLPQAVVAPGYGLIAVVKKDGTQLSGTLILETPEAITIKTGDGPDTLVPLTEIASKTDAISSMPPMSGILDPRQIRDLMAYLSTLK